MGIILAGSAAAMIITLAVPLAVLRAGIWQQEHAASLACRPRGLSAELARRVFGLYAHYPETGRSPGGHARPGGERAAADARPPWAGDLMTANLVPAPAGPGPAAPAMPTAAVPDRELPDSSPVAGLDERAG